MAGSCQVSVLVEVQARGTGAALSVSDRPVPRLAGLRLGTVAAVHHRRRPAWLTRNPRCCTFVPGEHVYTVYEQAGNRQYCSIDLHLLQAAARPVHNQSERAVNLVMTHRLRPGRDGLVFLLRFDRDWQHIGVVGGRVADGRAGALVVQLLACVSTVLT